jgi:hypothetical protein
VRNRHWIAGLLVAALCAPAAARATTLIVLDNSGSMAEGLAGGDSKAAEAARVLRETFVPGLPPGTRVALWTFGGGCRSLQFQGRFGDTSAAGSDLARIGPPLGGTPLAWSVRHALSEIRSLDEPHHLIVVTDGLDTCGLDPCSEVRRAAAAAAKITVHTVGLGMGRHSGEFRALQCMADASHEGTAQVVEPGDAAGELEAVLDRIARSVEEPRGELLVEVVDPRGTRKRDVGFVARSLDTGVEHRGQSGVPLALPPGRYSLHGGDDVAGEVEVRSGGRAHLEVAARLGRLVLRGACQGDLSWSILDASGMTVRTGTGSGASELDLPPGRYEVILNRYPHLPAETVDLLANRENSVSLGRFGTLLVAGRDAAERDLDLALEVFDDQGSAEAPPLATGETNREFQLPEGTYNVRVSPDDPRAAQFTGGGNVRIRPCEAERVELRQRAVLRVCGRSGEVRIWDDRDGGLTTGQAGAEIALPPGLYNLELPDGRLVANYEVREGLNDVGCP